MEELIVNNDTLEESEELFSYIDQCIIELEAEDGEMKILNSPSSGLSELRPVADILTLVKRNKEEIR